MNKQITIKTHHDIPDSMIPIKSFEVTTNGFIKETREDKSKYIQFCVIFRPTKENDIFIKVLEKMNKDKSKKSKSKFVLWAIPFPVSAEYDNIFETITNFGKHWEKAKRDMISCLKYDLWKYKYNKDKIIK